MLCTRKSAGKVFSDLGRVRHLKELNPDVRIGVGGCVASQEGKVIMSRAPYVDLVFGPQTIHRLPSLLAERQKKGKSQIDISFPEVEKFDNLPTPITTSQSAMVSIMEGCSKYCTFCVVPYTRGEEISRPFEDVLVEVATLATQGVKEITLLGQNVNAYYHEQDNEAIDFATLLDYVSEVPGVERIRFTTSHPKEFSAALIDSYRKLPKLVDHVHLPVQSGSDRVLEAMKRGYTRADYIKIIDDLKLARSTVSISSDFIVGFPGETASDFDDTMSLVDEVNFDGSFSFMYSPRPGTPAAALPSHVPLPIKKQRLSQLQDKLSENAFRFNQRMIGSEYDVLVEGVSKKDPSKLSGRTNSNKVINFEGQERLIGHTVKIEVTEALPNSLRGNVITRD